MIMMRIKIICLIIAFPWWGVHAQYLEVRRSATVKERPSREAIIIERVKKGYIPETA